MANYYKIVWHFSFLKILFIPLLTYFAIPACGEHVKCNFIQEINNESEFANIVKGENGKFVAINFNSVDNLCDANLVSSIWNYQNLLDFYIFAHVNVKKLSGELLSKYRIKHIMDNADGDKIVQFLKVDDDTILIEEGIQKLWEKYQNFQTILIMIEEVGDLQFAIDHGALQEKFNAFTFDNSFFVHNKLMNFKSDIIATVNGINGHLRKLDECAVKVEAMKMFADTPYDKEVYRKVVEQKSANNWASVLKLNSEERWRYAKLRLEAIACGILMGVSDSLPELNRKIFHQKIINLEERAVNCKNYGEFKWLEEKYEKDVRFDCDKNVFIAVDMKPGIGALMDSNLLRSLKINPFEKLAPEKILKISGKDAFRHDADSQMAFPAYLGSTAYLESTVCSKYHIRDESIILSGYPHNPEHYPNMPCSSFSDRVDHSKLFNVEKALTVLLAKADVEKINQLLLLNNAQRQQLKVRWEAANNLHFGTPPKNNFIQFGTISKPPKNNFIQFGSIKLREPLKVANEPSNEPFIQTLLLPNIAISHKAPFKIGRKRVSNDDFMHMILTNLMKDYAEYDAEVVYTALREISHKNYAEFNANAVIEILTTRSKAQIRLIKRAFERLYPTTGGLEQAVKRWTNGWFQTVLIALCKERPLMNPILMDVYVPIIVRPRPDTEKHKPLQSSHHEYIPSKHFRPTKNPVNTDIFMAKNDTEKIVAELGSNTLTNTIEILTNRNPGHLMYINEHFEDSLGENPAIKKAVSESKTLMAQKNIELNNNLLYFTNELQNIVEKNRNLRYALMNWMPKNAAKDILNDIFFSKETLLSILSVAENRPKYFATLLHLLMSDKCRSASKSSKTKFNIKHFIRIIIMRSDIDISDIEKEYNEIAKRSLSVKMTLKETIDREDSLNPAVRLLLKKLISPYH